MSATDGTPAPNPAARQATIAFLLELGRALHVYGAGAPRVEQAMAACGRRLGVEGQYFATQTSIFASFGSGVAPHTELVRVEPGSVHLAKRVLLDFLVSDVLDGRHDVAAARARIAAIDRDTLAYPGWATTLSFALASAAAARFFDAGAREVAASACVGLAVGLLALGARRVAVLARIFEPLSAFVAASLAVALAAEIAPFSTYVVIVSGLIVLLPGLSLTTAMSELALGHLAAGTARFMGAAMGFLVLAFGVALGRRVGGLLTPFEEPAAAEGLPEWSLWLALLVAPACFTVLLRARARDFVWMLLAGWIAFFAARLGARLFGPELGVFIGACAVQAASNLYAHWRHRPSIVMSLPGILILVPGSIGFWSLAALIESDVLSGVETAFRMALVAVSLVAGLLLADAIVPPRDLERLVGERPVV